MENDRSVDKLLGAGIMNASYYVNLNEKPSVGGIGTGDEQERTLVKNQASFESEEEWRLGLAEPTFTLQTI